MSGLVLTDVREGVAVVSLNRPERHNAFTDALGSAFRDALHDAVRDPEVRAILIRGEGRSFSSGRDTSQLGTGGGDGGRRSPFERVGKAQELTMFIYESPKPFVAAMKGATLGGGFEICLAADIRIGATDLVVSLPEVLHGILPDTGGTQLLTSLIGPGRAKEMVLTGCRVDARTAYEWGIVNRLVAPEALDAECFAVARQLAAAPPLAVQIGKELVDDTWKGQVRSGTARERLAQALIFASDDYRETRAARSEQRTPRYEGR